MGDNSKLIKNWAMTPGALEPKLEIFEDVENKEPVEQIKISSDSKPIKNYALTPEEIEPKREVFEYEDVEEVEEPLRKKARISENVDSSATASSTIPFSVLQSMTDENRQLREEVSNFQTDIRNLHHAVLEISNSAIKERIQLEERVENLEAELTEKNRKLEEIVKESSSFTTRTIFGQKIWMDRGFLEIHEKIEVLEAQQKQEHSLTELREQVLTSLNMLETAAKQGDSKVEKRISSLETALKAKLKAYSKAIQECRDCVKEVTSGNVEMPKREEEVVPIDQKPVGLLYIVRSDECQLPPTRAELDYQAKCIFCKSKNHVSVSCLAVPDYAQRIRVLQKQHRCLMCLDMCDPDERHHCPREKVMCSNCEWSTEHARKEKDFHHEIVCKLNDQSKGCRKRKREENERRLRHGIAPRFVI